MIDDDITDDTQTHSYSLRDANSDYAPRNRLKHPQEPKECAQVAKKDSVIVSSPENRTPVVLTGGETFRAHLSELDAVAKTVAYTDLQNLHLAIGAQHVRFLPKYEDVEYDETTEVEEYLPIMVRVGTYNAAVKPKKKALKIEQRLELWAYHTLPSEPTEEYTAPVSLLEIIAYSKNQQHVPNLPGLDIEDTWVLKKQHIKFLPLFAHVRNETELCCWVRYCLLLAAAENLYCFDGLAVPREPGFTGVLVELCKRKWEDERFETFDRTGVLPNANDIWDGAVKLNMQKGKDVEQYSTSESEGKDEIPAIVPEGATQHLKKESSRRRRRRDSSSLPNGDGNLMKADNFAHHR
ncbi:hypothetical protein G6011_06148 [Alternaria panax]|uniref:Uncharacterized protein n=1 Tax=Alternaria panax TaxID=48097 RepID=A0AAD4FFT7_9PLEO|nr:hypothetical protein G6011_06148 [Alternaria panax]